MGHAVPAHRNAKGICGLIDGTKTIPFLAHAVISNRIGGSYERLYVARAKKQGYEWKGRLYQ